MQRPARIPADVFFGDRPSAPAFDLEAEDIDGGFSVVPEPARTRAALPADTFFPAAPPPPDRTLARWAADPFTHGLVLSAVGFVGTLVLASNILTQIVIGAPVFEELWKFGVALLGVAAFGLASGPARVLVALVPGAAFGLFEHYLTYPDEPVSILANRVLFHSGSTALSMAVYVALAPVRDLRVRWAATVPATALHWANNFAAVVLGVGSVVVGEGAAAAGMAVTYSIAVGTHVLAWATLAGERTVRGWALRLWVRHAPEELRSAR